MTTQQLLNRVQKEILDLDCLRRMSDSAAIKCEKDGLVFREKYPEMATERDGANAQIDSLEVEEARLKEQLATELADGPDARPEVL